MRAGAVSVVVWQPRHRRGVLTGREASVKRHPGTWGRPRPGPLPAASRGGAARESPPAHLLVQNFISVIHPTPVGTLHRRPADNPMLRPRAGSGSRTRPRMCRLLSHAKPTSGEHVCLRHGPPDRPEPSEMRRNKGRHAPREECTRAATPFPSPAAASPNILPRRRGHGASR